MSSHGNRETRARPGAHRSTAKRVRFHPGHASLPPGEGLHAERFYELVGSERGQDELTQRLRYYVQSLRPPVVGALHVACSDEAEHDCVQSFRAGFVRYLLPAMHFADRAAFRTRTLGGRYEWGSAAIAEQHYALAPGAEHWKAMVVKVNAHVSVEESTGGRRFGRTARYGAESVYCGALHALLAGETAPYAEALAADLSLEGEERLAALRDPSAVDAELAGLFIAIVSARQQARRAMLDVQDARPGSPTLYLVVPSVSLNRSGHDTELLVGVYTSDRRGDEPHDEWFGLGDDARAYRLVDVGGRLAVTDGESRAPRVARDHRELVLARWRERESAAQGGSGASRDSPAAAARVHPELAAALGEARAERAAGRPIRKALLATLLGVALEVAPIPAAVVLFGQGLLGIHHAGRAHRLARAAAGDGDAREMLREFHSRIDRLSPETAQHVVDMLLAEYGR